jgi:NADPH:quinone reductase
MKALHFAGFGGPEVLQYGDVAEPVRGEGRALISTRAIGLNFADIYRRRGNYHLAGQPPFIAGYEAAGVIESLPADYSGSLKVGDRVGFADVPHANAETVAAPLDHLVPLPASVSFESAAAILLQGLTAHYLTHDSHPIAPGQRALVHSAAGGVGLLLIQIIKILGAHPIALVSSEQKRAAALQAGATAAYLYSEDWVAAAQRHQVDVVYDAVGKTLAQSLDAVRNGGRVVFYGMAGGDPDPVNPRLLMDQSKTITGGDLWNVLTSGAQRCRRAAILFDWLDKGQLTATIAKRFTLADGAAAHAFLESRTSIGKVILLP